MPDNKFIELKKTILKRIESGEYPPGRAIPSERTLAEDAGISRMTVRHAITDLVSQGVLFRQQGRGTFVSASRFTQHNLMSFSKAISNKGKTPKTLVLAFGEAKAGEHPAVDQILNTPKYFIAKRLRLADDTPVALETVFIPFENCPNLKKEMLETSLHDLMSLKYALDVKSCELSVSAALCDEANARDLGVQKHFPVLSITSKYFTASGLLIYLEKALYRGDMYEYILYTVKGQTNLEP